MLLRYDDFILESLLLESKFEFSDRFKNVLSMMPGDNFIRNYLLSLRGADLNLSQNYIDVSDNKEEVTFIQDRRAQQIINDNQKVWKTNSNLPNSKFLTFNKDENGDYKNKLIFDALGFEPMEPVSENHPVPGPNVVGKILSEYVSTLSGRTYVLFAWNYEGTDKFICLNKEALDEHSNTEERLYKSNRNPIRIGRLINSLITDVVRNGPETHYFKKNPLTPQQIEQFTNQWKSAWDIANDAFLKFDVVSGYEIAKWYSEDNYESEDSTLGGSCMRYDYCSEFFGIYTENSDVVKLVILYSDIGGKLKDGKYKAPTIKGRALLWKTSQGDMFMDRIYTNNDSDVDLFKQYAEKNGWWCKKVQNSNSEFTACKGAQLKNRPTYTVDLSYADFEYYPYLDTLSFMRLNQLDSRDVSGTLSNDIDVISATYELRDTEGDRNAF